jgi:thiamine pyrophosphate-dependent acetolactate synthase large subunit-like protein
VGDAAETARALTEELARRAPPRTGRRTEALAAELRGYRRADEIVDQSTADTVDPRSLMVALDELLPAERTVAVDCGHFMGFPAMYMRVPDPAAFVFCQAFQSVGLGLAGGIAAAVARPDRVTVTVIGDGGTLMTMGELETAARLRLPVLVVVVNDAAYGAEVHHFAPMGRSTDLVFFPPTDFAAVGRAVGAQGHTIRRLAELSVVTEWLAAPDGPMVLDCRVNPAVNAEWLEEAFKGGG